MIAEEHTKPVQTAVTISAGSAPIRGVRKPARTSSSLIFKNSIWNVAANAMTGVVAFVLVPFMLGHLGKQCYGVWVLIGSAFAYSGVLGFGLSSAINRYIPVSLARGTDQDIRQVISTGTVFFCGVGLVLGVLTLLLYANLTAWFRIPVPLAATARATVLIVGVFACLAAVTQGFEAVLSGYQRYDLTGISRIVMVCLRAGLVVLLLWQGAGLLTIAWVYGSTELATKLLDYFFCLRLTPPGRVSWRTFDPKLLRAMLAYGVNTFLYGAGTVLTYKASELIIGAFLSTEDIALYSVAATSALVLSTMITSICAAIKPAASDLDARGDSQAVRELSIASQKYTLFLIVPSTAFLVIMGRDFLRVWTGLNTPELTLIIALLAIGQAFQMAQHSNFMVLVGKGEHRLFGICVALIGLTTVGLALLSAGILHRGLVGIAVSNLLPLILVCGVIIPWQVNRQLGLTWRDRMTRVWKPVLAVCPPSVLLLWAWDSFHAPSSWAEIGLVVVFTASATGFMVWLVGLDDKERARFRGFVQRLHRLWPAAEL